jgi:PAS domain S-box-containing protein
MTGWSSADVIGKSPRMFQGPKTDLRIFSDLRDKLEANQAWNGQAINYRKNGQEFWMEWSIVPLINKRGRVYRYVAVQRDVSARVDTNRRLLAAQAAERVADRARANLARYFSPKLVETLAAKDQPLGAVRRQNLAVLFVDIVGFTSLSELLEPEQVIEILRDVHDWIGKVIFGHDGSIEGYIGDAVLAIFGFPETQPQDAGRALACAYDLLCAAQSWNSERADRGQLPIKIGLGLQYGPVVLGDVGTEEYVEFTVIGDTVNTASRLQQATRTLDCDLVVGQNLVDAVVAENGSSQLDSLLRPLRRHGELTIRGRSQSVEVSTYTLTPTAP